MIRKLEEHLPRLPGLRWTRPRGGLFLWLVLPEYMDTIEMFPAALEKKVAYVVGKAFFPDGTGQNCMRLNFSFATFEQIDAGIARLAQLVKDEELRHSSSLSSNSA